MNMGHVVLVASHVTDTLSLIEMVFPGLFDKSKFEYVLLKPIISPFCYCCFNDNAVFITFINSEGCKYLDFSVL